MMKKSIYSGKQNNTKHVRAQEQGFQIHKIKTIRTEKRYIHNHSCRFQHSSQLTDRTCMTQNTEALNNVFNQLALTDIKHSTPKHWDSHSFQVHTECSPS